MYEQALELLRAPHATCGSVSCSCDPPASTEGPARLRACIELLRGTVARFSDNLCPALDGRRRSGPAGVPSWSRFLKDSARPRPAARSARRAVLRGARNQPASACALIRPSVGPARSPNPGEEVPEDSLIPRRLDSDCSDRARPRATLVAAREAFGGLDQELHDQLGADEQTWLRSSRIFDGMASVLGADAPRREALRCHRQRGCRTGRRRCARPARVRRQPRSPRCPDRLHNREQVVAALDREVLSYGQHEAARPMPLW